MTCAKLCFTIKDSEAYVMINRISEGRFVLASMEADASDENKCGDSLCACALPDEKVALMLSDGMGKGTVAAMESRRVIEELRKLLKRGVAPSKAIKIVNEKLISDNEIFATIDLAIIDKKKSTACFYKMGATSSFLIRDKHVKKIERAALPVGVVGKVSASQIKVKLKSKDTMVIVSDGVTEADWQDLDCNWLKTYLKELSREIGPRRMATLIAKEAQRRYAFREKDDLSVLVVQIE